MNDLFVMQLDKVNPITKGSAMKRIMLTIVKGLEVRGRSAQGGIARGVHFWERGLNENSNGLLWQHFPKCMGLIDFTDGQVQKAVAKLNHCPRKLLWYEMP